MDIPSSLFIGLKGDVKISVKVLDAVDVPEEYRVYAGDKNVIRLDMSVGGT